VGCIAGCSALNGASTRLFNKVRKACGGGQGDRGRGEAGVAIWYRRRCLHSSSARFEGQWLADRQFRPGTRSDTTGLWARWVRRGPHGHWWLWATLYKFLPNTNAPFRIHAGPRSSECRVARYQHGFRLIPGHVNTYRGRPPARGRGIFLTADGCRTSRLLSAPRSTTAGRRPPPRQPGRGRCSPTNTTPGLTPSTEAERDAWNAAERPAPRDPSDCQLERREREGREIKS